MVWSKLIFAIGVVFAFCCSAAYGSSFLDHVQKPIAKKSANPLEKHLRLPRSQPKGIFDWSGDDESMKELRLASISLMKNALNVVIYGLAWSWFTKSLRHSIGKLVDFIKSQKLGENGPFTLGSAGADLEPYIISNSTFSAEESSVLSQFQLPNRIDEAIDDLGGLAAVKDSILQQFFVANDSPQVVIDSSRIVQSPERSIWWKDEVFESKHSALLFGPPGCGKTSLVRGLCRKFDCPMLEVTPSMVQHSYFGESTKAIRAIFSVAKKLTRCVIFFDEVDALFSARKRDDQSFERSLKTELIQAWDSLLRAGSSKNIFIFGATNRPQDLDPAILRRFERSFMLPLPDEFDRVAIWKALLTDVPLVVFDGQDFDFSRCAQLTEGFCTSDIRQLCQIALGRMKTGSSQHLRPLHIEDIEVAAKTFIPTTWAASSFGRREFGRHSNQRPGNGPPFGHPFTSPAENDHFRSWSSPSPFDDDNK